MSEIKKQFPGSRWWKIDFHTHTPASTNDFPDTTEDQWLEQAMRSNIDCVVVTDHNSGDWIDQLKQKNKELAEQSQKPEWYRELTIFPGVEITVANSSDRVHLLAVFAPDCDGSKITAVLGSCGISSGFGDDQNTTTTTGFAETVKKIEEADGIAIPAHVDKEKGLLAGKTTLNPELKKSLRAVNAIEVVDNASFSDINLELEKEIKRLAHVTGSDAHKPEDIGTRFSWIKMSRPSLSGLKLALYDHEFCVKNQEEDPNKYPEKYITTITIQNMHHCGRVSENPFSLSFHPLFNAIIGGRGTGKSTALESMRIALRRDNNLEREAPGIKENLDKFMKLHDSGRKEKGVMLNDTQIYLNYHRRGKLYRLFWRYDGSGAVLQEKTDDSWQDTDSGDIQERFPVKIFSQKQIYELALNPRGLLQIIDSSPGVNRKEWDGRWREVESHYLQLCEKKRNLEQQLGDEKNIRAKLKDVENDLREYEKKGHGEILKEYQKRSKQNSALPRDDVFDSTARQLREHIAEFELSDFPSHVFDEDDGSCTELLEIHKKIEEEMEKITTAVRKCADEIEALRKTRKNQIKDTSWYKKLLESKRNYEELQKRYEEKGGSLNLSLYEEWTRERNRLSERLKQMISIKKEIDATKKQIDELQNQFVTLRNELKKRREDFIENTVGTSDFVKMELIQYGDTDTVEDEYRELLHLDSGKFTSSVLDNEAENGILYNLYNEENPENIPVLIEKIKQETIAIANRKEDGAHGAFNNRLEKLKDTSPSSFDRLMTWFPEDLLKVRYKDSSGGFHSLEKGSAGQKSAAVLAFLLSYGDDPLIIDQPEDDLDNALIYELIVRQIHENKNRRQIIIVTHNPNIVVNGDAELIHVLDFGNGQIQLAQEDGLGEPEIRESVCKIMEGGQEAFRKRYNRINLEV